MHCESVKCMKVVVLCFVNNFIFMLFHLRSLLGRTEFVNSSDVDTFQLLDTNHTQVSVVIFMRPISICDFLSCTDCHQG